MTFWVLLIYNNGSKTTENIIYSSGYSFFLTFVEWGRRALFSLFIDGERGRERDR